MPDVDGADDSASNYSESILKDIDNKSQLISFSDFLIKVQEL
jgi:hypothetical protein